MKKLKTIKLTGLVNCPHCQLLNEFPMKVSKNGMEDCPAFIKCASRECGKNFGLGYRFETKGMLLDEHNDPPQYSTYDSSIKKYIN